MFDITNWPFIFSDMGSCMVVSPGGNRVSTPSMCGEHGHCISTPGAGYRCSCLAGYTGKYCHESE